MEAFLKAMKKKMKRKDLDQVNDDFSDFSLSSPARKIRRLVLSLAQSSFYQLMVSSRLSLRLTGGFDVLAKFRTRSCLR